jgi:hypothetical protein
MRVDFGVGRRPLPAISPETPLFIATLTFQIDQKYMQLSSGITQLAVGHT